MASEFQASGVAQLWFVPVIADMDAPTAAEIAAGEYLNCDLIGFEGLSLEQTYIENPSGCSKIVGKVAGLSNLGEPKFDFKLYDGGVTASNPLLTDLAVGTEGYIVYAYSGVNGTGTIRRNESVTLRVAATVSQVLPNGNLVVTGRQQVRVNSELRDLTVGGVIRPQDIASDNTVRHDRLAEARIAYGGRGTISDIQRPRVGQELLDIILPF